MSVWLRHHWLSLAHTAQRLASTPFASLLNIMVIGIALALPLGGYALLVNLQLLAGEISTDPQISVFMSPSASRAEATEIEKKLRAAPGVQGVEFVGRDQALAGLKRRPGMAEVISSLRDNPLPDAFVVTLSASAPELARRLGEEFSRLPRVAQVQSDSAWAQRVDSLLRLWRTAVVLLAGLLGFALVAVTFNTIRLQILTLRAEIEVEKLIGATDSYIRRPFYYLGVIQGTLGALTAIGLIHAGLFLLNRDLSSVALAYGTQLGLEALGLRDSLTVLVFAGILGWLGAHLSVSNYLHEIEPQ